MIIYILFFVVALNAFISVFAKGRNRKTIVISLFIFLLYPYILSFIRWETGTDWDSYYQIFQDAKYLDIYYSVEPTFFFINYLSHQISDSYSFLLFILATIIFLYTYGSIKYVVYPFVTYLIFFSSTLGNIMFIRQSISVVIILYSYIYILNKAKKKFYLCIILASLFHTSAIIALPLYYIFNLNIKYKYILLGLGLVCVISLHTSNNNFWLKNLPLGEFINYKINNYLNQAQYGSDSYITISTTKAILNHIIKRSILIVLLILCSRKKLFSDLVFRGYLNVYLYSSCLYLFTAPLSMNLTRVCTGIEMVDVFLYPYILYHVKRPTNKLLAFLIILIFAFSKFASNISRYPDIFTTYKTIFS